MASILVVDDEEIDRLFERSVLADAGHELYFASDGEGALKVYNEHPIDLVVTDLHMPKVNGLRLIQELKERDPKAIVIAVSGVSASQLDLAEELGAVHTLFKPLDPAKLLEMVTEVLEEEEEEEDPWAFSE